MYKIGEFSKLVDMPVRTLRYYDEVGILKPEYTDTFSGYRYYTEDNRLEAETIKLLKSVDFTLDEILEAKVGLSLDMIDSKVEELSRQMYMLELKCQKLELMRENLLDNQNVYTNDSDVMVLRKVNNEGIRKAS